MVVTIETRRHHVRRQRFYAAEGELAQRFILAALADEDVTQVTLDRSAAARRG